MKRRVREERERERQLISEKFAVNKFLQSLTADVKYSTFPKVLAERQS